MTSNRLRVWAVAALVLLLGVGAFVFWKKSAAQSGAGSAAVPNASAAGVAKAAPTLELLGSEVYTVSEQRLDQTVAVSGTVKAVKTAAVKVRVAGEVQGLTLREGDTVKAGQVVARIDPTEVQARVRQAADQAEAAKAQVDIAQRQFDNNQSLVTQGFISKTALDNASASLNGAKASYQAALAAVDLAKRGLSDTVLIAPISGVVATRMVQNGERAGVEARVIDIVDLSAMELEAVVPAQDAALIKVGQTARLSLEGAGGVDLAAKVVRINPSAQAGSRGVVVYLSVAPHPALKNGVFAQGKVLVGTRSGLALPIGLVRNDKPSPYVQWIQNQTVVHQQVTLGARGETAGVVMVAISGIEAGSQVVSGTVGQLREGTLVRVAKPAAASVPASAGK